MRLMLSVLMLLLTAGSLPAAPETPATGAQSANELDSRIARLIEQLGAPEYATREKAQRELARLGLDAFEALSAAKDSDDAEIAAQARYLVRQIRFDWARETDPEELKDILKDYEGQAPAARMAKITQIAALADRPNLSLASLEWLCRLARFEESQLLSKDAALKAIAQSVPADPKAAAEHYAAISRTVARGGRPAAQWLKAYVLEATDQAAAVNEWNKLIAAEELMLDKPSETSPRLIATLLRRQVGLLDKLKRPDDSLKAIAKLVQLERGETASLLALLDWLRERQAWTIVDDVAQRFAGAIHTDATLLYALAQTRLAQGNPSLANELAEKAFAISPEKLEDHFALAAQLQERGLKDWSDREYRFIIEKLPPVNRGTIVARLILSEDLHDRQRDAEAADVLKPIVEAIDRGDADMRRMLDSMDRPPGGIKSRLLFFRSCEAQTKGDLKTQTELLDQGIVADPTDADVLIGLFRLPNQDEARRKQTRELITKAVEASREMIEEFPDDPTAYNQLAWLVGNTEGDFDEAIQLSLKSLELKRAGGYLDTLAHCYYAKGDYENAVRTQQEAAELEPHSQAIVRQLKVFKAALTKQAAAKDQ